MSPAVLAQLDALYREHHGYVWRNLQRLGVHDSHVADAMHDVFLVVARRLPEFEQRSSIRTWLFAIAFRVAQSFHRDRQRQERREQPIDDPDAGPGPDASPDTTIALHQLLARLDDDKRAVFILAHLEGMTGAEIATALDLKLQTVYSRLRVAREVIERALAEAPTHAHRRAQP